MSEAAIPFPFYSYGTSRGGLKVGSIYTDKGTGKRFRLCQAHTTLVGSVLVATATQFDPVVQIGAGVGSFGVASDDVSAGLDATNPFCLGVPTSACPVSTSTITYYFWAQTFGYLHTTLAGGTFASIKMNNDDDAAIGDTIIMTSTDAACNTIATGTVGISQKAVGYVLVAVAASTNLVTGVFLNCGLNG
jgi:hypothetical protein